VYAQARFRGRLRRGSHTCIRRLRVSPPESQKTRLSPEAGLERRKGGVKGDTPNRPGRPLDTGKTHQGLGTELSAAVMDDVAKPLGRRVRERRAGPHDSRERATPRVIQHASQPILGAALVHAPRRGSNLPPHAAGQPLPPPRRPDLLLDLPAIGQTVALSSRRPDSNRGPFITSGLFAGHLP
jgi:hypothetical protein